MLVAAAAAAVASAAAAPRPRSGVPTLPTVMPPLREDRSWEQVNALLQNVTLSLGDIPIDLPEYGVTTTLGDTKVSALSVGALSLAPARAAGEVSVEMHVAALNAEVASDEFSLTVLGLSAHGTAHFAAALGVDIVLVFAGPVDAAPTAVSVASCQARFDTIDVQCQGNSPISLLPTICATLQGILRGDDFLDGILCPMISDLAADLSPQLANISQWLDELEHVPPPPPAHQAEAPFNGRPGLFHFNSSTAVNMTRMVLNDVYGAQSTIVPDELVINEVLRRAFGGLPIGQNTSGTFPVGIDLGGFPVAGIAEIKQLTIVSITMSDTEVEAWDLLEVVGSLSTEHHLGMSANVSLTLNMTVAMLGDFVQPAGAELTELLTLKFAVKDMVMFLRSLVAAESASFADLTIGGLTASWGNMLNCIMEPIVTNGLQLQFLDLSLSTVQLSMDLQLVHPQPSEPGGGINALFSDLLNAVVVLYGPSVDNPTLRGLAVSWLSPLLNDLIRSIQLPACDPVADISKTTPISFPDNTLASLLNWFLNDVTGEISTPEHPNDADINKIISTLTAAQSGHSGELTFQDWVYDNNGEKIVDVDMGHIRLHVRDLAMSSVDSMNKFTLLKPGPRDYTLDNNISLGNTAAKPRLSLGIHWEWSGIGDKLDNDFTVNMSISNMQTMVDLLAALDAAKTSAVRLGDITDTGCLLSAITDGGFNIPDLLVAFQESDILLECAECSSPLLSVLGANLADPGASVIVTRALNKVFEVARETLTCEQAGQEYSRWVSTAQCPSPAKAPKEERDDTPGIIVLYVFVGGTTLIVAAVTAAFTYARARRVLRAAREDPGTAEADAFTALRADEALFWNPVVPRWAKWGVPFVLLAGLGSLISGHLDPSACYVDVELDVAGQHVQIDHAFDFSLHTAVVDMWNAGVYPLAVGVAVFSGAWAYIKLILLFWVWFMPPTVLRIKGRTTVLEFMDFFGKYSLVDLYVMLMMTVAFRLHMKPPTDGDWAVLPEGFVIVDLIVRPGWGLAGYLIAVITALIIGHIEVVQHRNAVAAEAQEPSLEARRQSFASHKSAQRRSRLGSFASQPRSAVSTVSTWFQQGAEDSRKEPLMSHVFRNSPWPAWMTMTVESYSRGRTSEVRVLRPVAKVAVTVLLFVALTGLIVGIIIPSFSFEFKGLAAAAVMITPGEETKTLYSVVGLPFHMMKQAGDYWYDWIMYPFVAIICYFITTVVAPILQFVTLLIAWLKPMTISEQKRFFFINECMAASSAMEVFIMSIIAALLQLSQFAGFIVGDKCDVLDPTLDLGYRLGAYPEDQKKCFDVKARLESGCWLLFTCCLFSNLAYFFFHSANKRAIEDREDAIMANDERAEKRRRQQEREERRRMAADSAEQPDAKVERACSLGGDGDVGAAGLSVDAVPNRNSAMDA